MMVFHREHRFSIRKFSVGAASVLIGFAFQAQAVAADGVTPTTTENQPSIHTVSDSPQSSENRTEETPKAELQPEAPKTVETEIPAADKVASLPKTEEKPQEEVSSTPSDKEDVVTPTSAEKETADKAAKDKKAADQLTAKQKERAERKLAEKKATEAKKQNKPTPEQILNSGSIEKARKAANASATKESSNAASKQSAEKAEAAANSGKKAFLQLGSYADRSSADSQRAKLAILGVSSKVVESQNGDKTIYRVQSNTMPQEAAVKLQKNLQGHNINSLIRSTK